MSIEMTPPQFPRDAANWDWIPTVFGRQYLVHPENMQQLLNDHHELMGLRAEHKRFYKTTLEVAGENRKLQEHLDTLKVEIRKLQEQFANATLIRDKSEGGE